MYKKWSNIYYTKGNLLILINVLCICKMLTKRELGEMYVEIPITIFISLYKSQIISI